MVLQNFFDYVFVYLVAHHHFRYVLMVSWRYLVVYEECGDG